MWSTRLRDLCQKWLHAPKTVQVCQDKVQVRCKPKSGEPSDCFMVRLMHLLIHILSSRPVCIFSSFAVYPTDMGEQSNNAFPILQQQWMSGSFHPPLGTA
jgi:hypothetical protein